jgi:rhodanese-related sulfurtransferase
MKSREDLLKEAREVIPEMTVHEVNDYLLGGERPALLDVRGLDEWEMGHLKGAVHIARGNLELEVEDKLADKSGEVVVYCAGGVRSLLAGQRLKDLGYERVISMDGGFDDWEEAGLPLDRPPSPEEDEDLSHPDLLETEIEHLEAMVRKRKDQLTRARDQQNQN